MRKLLLYYCMCRMLDSTVVFRHLRRHSSPPVIPPLTPPPPLSPPPASSRFIQVENRHSAWEHSRLVPPGSGGIGNGAAAAGGHFAPFQPDAEDHLRNFAVSVDERRQMEEDYRLALAMQKGEAAAAAGSRGEVHLFVLSIVHGVW